MVSNIKKFKLVGLCLVALVAISGFVAAAASATKPEFNAPTSETMKFTSSGGEATLKIKGGISIKCSSTTNAGEILPGASKKEGSVTVTFKGCKAAGVDPCHSVSPAGGSEEIITNLLTMTLGYIVKATEVGVDLSATTLAEIECPVLKDIITVTGSVIGVITPLNMLTNEFKLKFSESAEKQVPTKFEGKPEDTLKSSINGGTPLASTETAEDTIGLGEETNKEGKKVKIELEILA